MSISPGTETTTAVFGYGVEGRSAAAWLARHGCRVVRVISKERPDDLPAGAAWVSDLDPDAAMAGITLLIKSPGIPPGHPVLSAAARDGVAVTSPTVLFVERAREAGLSVIGVTGSKGKSTTATLAHLTLHAAGIPSVLVGNIGRPALDVMDQVAADRPVVVFEMSSYQTYDLTIGPSVAVITRLFPEHLDWHGSAASYFRAKLNIATTQRPDDLTLWNGSDRELAARAPFGPARHLAYGVGPPTFSLSGMKLRGPHNVLNAQGALAAAARFGARPAHLESVLRTFGGLPHRLEDLGVHGGIRWINDSIATAPEAAVAALDAYGSEVGTYIGGGTDRGFDFTSLARALSAFSPGRILLLPPGGAAILAALTRIDPRLAARARLVADLAEAVSLAAATTPTGATVLFSPASPSYGVFRNFEERGNVFRALVDQKERR